jgi:hypothetical protein
MKNIRFVILCFLLFSFACTDLIQNKDIEKVKNSSLRLGELGIGFQLANPCVVGVIVKHIAGIKGTVQWKSFRPTGYENNPNVVCVQVDITRNLPKNNLVMMQFLLNRETDLVEIACFKVDGEKRSLVNWIEIFPGE